MPEKWTHRTIISKISPANIEEKYGECRYRNGKAIRNVSMGTMLRKAQAKVADVYSMPRRKRYCDADTLYNTKRHTMLKLSSESSLPYQ